MKVTQSRILVLCIQQYVTQNIMLLSFQEVGKEITYLQKTLCIRKYQDMPSIYSGFFILQLLITEQQIYLYIFTVMCAGIIHVCRGWTANLIMSY